MTVLGPVAVDHLVVTGVTEQREVHLQDVGARLNDLQDPMCFLHLNFPWGPDVLHKVIHQSVLGFYTGLVEEILHALKEARILSKETVNEDPSKVLPQLQPHAPDAPESVGCPSQEWRSGEPSWPPAPAPGPSSSTLHPSSWPGWQPS